MTKARNIADGVDAGDIASSAVTTAKIADGNVTTDKIADVNVTTGKIADNAVTLAKMASGTDGNLISYDTSGNPVAVATGSAGQVLTSAGAGAVPSFATPTGGFSFNAVTGATPSLNLGTYNFFDNGTLAANTTVSFASVPTEANWKYTFEVGNNSASAAWDISTAISTRTFSASAQDNSIHGLFFKPDGTEMYLVGEYGRDVNQYTLSTAWDISSASYVRVFSVASQSDVPSGIFFKPDGTEMYVCGQSGDNVIQYTLSTAWNISTASYTRVVSSGIPANPRCVFFKPDGIEMYAVGGNVVYEYKLTVPYTVTLPAAIENPPTIVLALGSRYAYDFFTKDGGTTVTLLSENKE